MLVNQKFLIKNLLNVHLQAIFMLKKQTDIKTTKLIFGRGTPCKGLKPSKKLHKKFGAFFRFVTIWPKIDAKPPH